MPSPVSLPPLLRFAPVAVASLDLHGRIVDANEALAAASGYSRDELIGELFSRFIAPDNEPAARASFGALAAGAVDAYRAERQFVTKGGDVRTVDLSVSLVRDAAGRPEVTLAVLQDVTAHKRALEDLKFSEARYRALIEQAPFSVQILSPAGVTLQVNAAWERLWGVKLEQIEGYNLLQDQQLVERGLMPAIQRGFAGEACELPPTLYDPNQTIPDVSDRAEPARWVRAVIYPIKDERGQIREVVLIHEDISDKKRAEEERQRVEEERERLLLETRRAHQEAEAASRVKDEFLATLSHELRTPLNAVIGWTRILRTRATEDASAHALDIIERNAWAQARMIDDLLDVSRIVTGKIRLHVEQVDVGGVALSALESMRPAAEAKGVRLIARIAPTLPPIAADAPRLQQVLWNLLSNGVKFTNPGGEVVLTIDREAHGMVIVVSDTGIGITAATLPYVFDRFTQGDSSSTRTHAGLGLGLAIVRHVVELHGGSVSAASDGPDRGAAFRVWLPVP